MKKSFLFILFLFITICMINISCENATQTDYLSSHLKGTVLDSITHNGLDSVTISIPDLSLSGITGSTGYFQFLNIKMPRDPMGTVLYATRNGYGDVNKNFILRSNDTTVINITMLHN